MKYKFYSALAILLAALLCFAAISSCKTNRTKSNDTIIVSIAPLKYIVEFITCGDFKVEVLLPEGAGAETYSPTPKQISEVENAIFLFTTGLIDFENEIVNKVGKSLNSPNKIFSLSDGIQLLSGSCSHSYDEEHHSHSGHSHGVDPHIWTSPEQLKVMALNAYKTITNAYPDSIKYTTAYNQLNQKLVDLSEWVKTSVHDSGAKKFIVYHPALTYYAADYGLEQIAIENEGKEPSVTHMKNIIDEARLAGINKVMYQREFPRSVVEPIARELNAEIIEINPLSGNIIEEIVGITNVITNDINTELHESPN